MRVGSIVFATEQGLGYLAKDFYDAGIVTDVAVVVHQSRRTMPWYPAAVHAYRRDLMRAGMDLVDCVDALLFFETPFDWSLIDYAARQGKPTALMFMHECTPEVLPAKPTLLLAPSNIELPAYPSTKCQVPAPAWAKWRPRFWAEQFVHNAGHGGLRGRNGTKELLQAWALLKTDARLLLRVQDASILDGCNVPKNVEVRVGTAATREELYATGDVFIFPEKFCGLSLPLQEAHASGMAIMALKRRSLNWLPQEPLLPVAYANIQRLSSSMTPFVESVIDPQALADHIDKWYCSDIEALSLAGKAWAEANSWDVHKDFYKAVLSANSVHSAS